MDQTPPPPAPQPDPVPPPAPVPAPAVPAAPVAPAPAADWNASGPASAPPHWQSAPNAVGPAPGVEFAGFGARLIAYLVDGFIVGVIMFALSLLLVPLVVGTNRDGELSGAGAAAIMIYTLIVIVVGIMYFPFFWQRSGQTPGMKMLGIRVVKDRDGGPVGWGSAILRYIGMAINSIILGLPIGWIWPLFDSRRRGWHDLIGGTVVIKA